MLADDLTSSLVGKPKKTNKLIKDMCQLNNYRLTTIFKVSGYSYFLKYFYLKIY